MVAASPGHEFSVGPLLLHLSILNEENLVGRRHRLQVVSHQENSAPSGENLPQHLNENIGVRSVRPVGQKGSLPAARQRYINNNK